MGECSFCRLLNSAITLVLMGVGTWMIWTSLGEPDASQVKGWVDNTDFTSWVNNRTFSGWNNWTNVLDSIKGIDFGDLMAGDPFLSNNETSSWPNNGNGLQLTIQNALDENWHDELELAVSDWDNGDPDTLTLQIQDVGIDYDCQQVDGVMKVCNNNFGETGWLGINEILKTSTSKIIQSSVAKMNEYYLANAGTAERQYTMCHEVGHGFGLPHTDENFNNAPLGNCLDYTNRPEENMHPDSTNYNRLATIYGVVGGSTTRQDQARVRDVFGSRRLGANSYQPESPSANRRLSPELRQEYEQAVRELEDPISIPTDTQWRKLHEHSQGAVLQRKLGEEYILEVTMLFA